MKRIIVDGVLKEQLSHLLQSVEVCDVNGKVLGRFMPVLDAELLASLQPDVSESELERREQESARPLAAILADFRQRP